MDDKLNDRSNIEEVAFGSSVRLKSIEAFHLFSSSIEWPNSVAGRLHFAGLFDIENARLAWQHCLQRHIFATWPLKSTGRPSWETKKPQAFDALSESFHDTVVENWPDSESELSLPAVNQSGMLQVDMQKGPGVGLWCVRSKDNKRVTLFLAANHALADGAAGVNFLREWMLAYHNLETGNDTSSGMAKLDWNLWKSRSRLGLFEWSFLKFLPLQAIGLFGATKFVLRKFSTVEPAANIDAEWAGQSPGLCGCSIDPQIVNDLNDRAERLGVSENSILMSIAFRAMKKIRRAIEADERCRWNERKWIRLVLPISIRKVADRKLPSANRASLVQIERTMDQVADADTAAQSIDREIKIIMGFRLDFVFLIAIRLLSVSSSLLKIVARNQKSRGTTVFTNLSEPFRKTRACDFRSVGGMKLIDYDLFGPLRSGTPFNIAWSKFRSSEDESELHGRISLHFDRGVISPELAKQILNAVESELKDVAQFGGSSFG